MARKCDALLVSNCALRARQVMGCATLNIAVARPRNFADVSILDWV